MQERIFSLSAVSSSIRKNSPSVQKRKPFATAVTQAWEAIAPRHRRKSLAGFVCSSIPHRKTLPAASAKIPRCAMKSLCFDELPLLQPEAVDDLLGLFVMLVELHHPRELVALRGDRILTKLERFWTPTCSKPSESNLARHLGQSVSTFPKRKITPPLFKDPDEKRLCAEKYERITQTYHREIAAQLRLLRSLLFSAGVYGNTAASPGEYRRKLTPEIEEEEGEKSQRNLHSRNSYEIIPHQIRICAEKNPFFLNKTLVFSSL